MTPALEDPDTERRQPRLALALTLAALCDNCMAGDGYDDEAWRALHAAAPLLGIDLEPRPPGPDGEERVRRHPHVQNVLWALQASAGASPQPAHADATARRVALTGLHAAARRGDAHEVCALAATALAVAWRTIDTLRGVPEIVVHQDDQKSL